MNTNWQTRRRQQSQKMILAALNSDSKTWTLNELAEKSSLSQATLRQILPELVEMGKVSEFEVVGLRGMQKVWKANQASKRAPTRPEPPLEAEQIPPAKRSNNLFPCITVVNGVSIITGWTFNAPGEVYFNSHAKIMDLEELFLGEERGIAEAHHG